MALSPGLTSDAVIPEWTGSDRFNIWSAISGNDGQNHSSPDGYGWANTMGGSTSDGLWHCYEVHLKMDTDGYNGIGQMWIDEVEIMNYTNIDYGTTSGWAEVLIGSNQRAYNNGRCMAVDFDDIAISNTGYIGPIGGPSPPSTPQNPRIKK